MSQRIIYLRGYPARGTVTINSQPNPKPPTPTPEAFHQDPQFFALSLNQSQNNKTLPSRLYEKRWAFSLIGTSLTTTAIIIFLTSIVPFVVAEAKWRLSQTSQSKSTLAAEKKYFLKNPGLQMEKIGLVQLPKTEDVQAVLYQEKVEKLKPVDSQFSIVIPKIDLNSPVHVNIPLGDKQKYQSVLENGVAHAKGSYLPGEKGNIYLFAHSTSYDWFVSQLNAVFYLLKELEPGDEVNIFYQEKFFAYKVVDKKITEASQISLLKPDSNQERLILQTCWPPGSTWKRLIVTADRV